MATKRCHFHEILYILSFYFLLYSNAALPIAYAEHFVYNIYKIIWI